MRVLRWSMIICLVLATGGHAVAVGVLEFSLEKKVHLSDVVFVGRVEQVNVRDELVEYSHVQVDKILKGTLPDTIDVRSKGTITEGNTDCCEVGGTYLFFLKKTNQKNLFVSVNGRFGIYRIPSGAKSGSSR